jgi:hypothetical protein
MVADVGVDRPAASTAARFDDFGDLPKQHIVQNFEDSRPNRRRGPLIIELINSIWLFLSGLTCDLGGDFLDLVLRW